MRFIVLSTLLLLLAACTGAPFTKSLSLHPKSQLHDQELFIAALDQFSASNKLELMDELRQRFPDSVWAEHAETITLYARELDNRKAQLSALEEKTLLLNDELAALKQENLLLNEKIEQLKTLLIELEQRPQ